MKTICSCGKSYRFSPENKGRKAKCRACGQIFVIGGGDTYEPRDTAKDEDWGYQLADLEKGEQVEAPQYASETTHPTIQTGQATFRSDSLTSQFLRSVAWSFALGSSPHNMVIIAMLTIMLAIAQFIGGLPCFGLIGLILIMGVWVGYKFQVIASAANGEEQLPPLESISGYGGMFMAVILSILSWIVVLTPLAVLLFVSEAYSLRTLASDFASSGTILGVLGVKLTPPVILFVLGLFMWPMVILCLVLGGVDSLIRVDLILVTVLKTLPYYALVAALLIGVNLLHAGIGEVLARAPGTNAAAGQTILIGFVQEGVGVYFTLVSYRIIGLYYHHFKSRFAWSWG